MSHILMSHTYFDVMIRGELKKYCGNDDGNAGARAVEEQQVGSDVENNRNRRHNRLRCRQQRRPPRLLHLPE